MHGAHLLGEQPKPPSLTLYVPRGYETGDVVIVGVCNVCGTQFREGEEQAWQRHVGDCYRRNEAEIRASSPVERNRGGPFDPDTWDREADEHMLEVGRRMRREGRWEVLPHERVVTGGG